MKGLVCFNYCGSGAIGAMNAGVKIDKVLEISDEMITTGAAKHFMHNYPEIPVISPTIWENDEYLYNLKNEEYDIMIGWPPCSSLSQINRNANVDEANNIHFNRYFNVVKHVEPKAFIVENAPTLLKLGKPILNGMVDLLGDKYTFTLMRDFGKNHDVAMRRQRTFIVGWRRDVFDNKVPQIEVNKSCKNVKDIIGDLYGEEIGKSTVKNFELVPNRTCKDVEFLIPEVKKNITINYEICSNYEKYENVLPEKFKKSIQSMLFKVRNGKRYWDKSPVRVAEDYLFPSMASVVEIIHPIHNRQLTIREYARIMGYPDSFEFVDCETPIIQCISQGVPVKYFEWVSGEVKRNLEEPTKLEDADIVYQHNVSMYKAVFSKEAFKANDDITAFDKENKIKM